MMTQLTKQIAASLLPRRTARGAKWDFGRLLCVCGSQDMPGAAVLCCRAAARSGVGLLRLASVRPVTRAVGAGVAECTFRTLAMDADGAIVPDTAAAVLDEARRASAMVIGPGLGRGSGVLALAMRLVAESPVPVVADADALFALAAGPNALKAAVSPVVLTPHVVELSRLTGQSVRQIMENPAKAAADFAAGSGAVTVLKGADTFIASPGGEVYVNSLDNTGLAKGGSGDVLAGLLGGLLAQAAAAGMDGGEAAFRMAALAVYVHSQAGDIVRHRLGERAMLPGDLIAELGNVFSALEG